MQDSLNVEKTPTCHHIEHVSGATQALFLPKFKATENELGQKRQHHGVYMIYLSIYLSIYLYLSIYIYTYIYIYL